MDAIAAVVGRSSDFRAGDLQLWEAVGSSHRRKEKRTGQSDGVINASTQYHGKYISNIIVFPALGGIRELLPGSDQNML